MEVESLTVLESSIFTRWLRSLSDRAAVMRIAARMRRLQCGLFGDVRDVGEGVFELKVDCGPGYRLYGMRKRDTIVLLLCGGDKGSQRRDVKRAKNLARRVREGALSYEESV